MASFDGALPGFAPRDPPLGSPPTASKLDALVTNLTEASSQAFPQDLPIERQPAVKRAKSTDGFHVCGIDGCTFRSKWSVARHRANVHNFGGRRHECQYCTFVSKEKGNLVKHQARVHDINANWFTCEVIDCTYATTAKADLTKHKAAKHDINATFYTCGIDDCKFAAKSKWELKKHQSNQHNSAEWHLCPEKDCK
ncbi:hypothetical protein TeGR_g11670 [Tetraparma gracilis]|uniref:C2H2-type domain-containing protein n=1 Tax=Tetraparma gracilis TaxID=2962635 RepID=A0ABQ6MLV7_9STRA|nr:hypothetical protein TeGR_g11670 [Tetraparma gracilis]